MTKIMFVCLGNICRSPMAEIIFRDMVKKSGRQNDFIVASSATSNENVWNGIGAEVYPPAKRILAKHGLSANGKRAVQLTKSDFDKYDMFICMDSNNVRNVNRIFGMTDCEKIYKLMSFTDRHGDVSDPWYTGDFETAYNDIYEGCKALFNKLTN